MVPSTTVPYSGLIPILAESALQQSMPKSTTPLVHGSYSKPATTISVGPTTSQPNRVFSLAPYGADAVNLPPFKQLPEVINFHFILCFQYTITHKI